MHDFMALKTMGVSPEFVREVRSSGWNDVSVHDLIALKAQGVSPTDAGQYRQLGLKDVTLHQLICIEVDGRHSGIHPLHAVGWTFEPGHA